MNKKQEIIKEVVEIEESEDIKFHENVLTNLKVNQEFSSFRSLCSYLNEKDYSGATQKKYLENKFARFFDWENPKGYKIVIKNIYDIPVPKIRSDSFASGFIKLFYFYINIKLRDEYLMNNSDKPYYKCILTTSMIAKDVGLYNTLWSYLYHIRNLQARPLLSNMNEKQMQIIYNMIEQDMSTIITSICYNGLAALSKENRAIVSKTYVYAKKDNSRLVELSKEEEDDFTGKYYHKALRKNMADGGANPITALEKANEERNLDLGLNDFIHTAWKIIVNKDLIDGLIQVSWEQRVEFEEFLQNKRILKLRNRFEKECVGWGDKFIFSKDCFDEFLNLIKELTINVGLNEDNNTICFDILDKNSDEYQESALKILNLNTKPKARDLLQEKRVELGLL